MLVSKNEGLRQKKRKNRKLWIFAPESIRGQKDDQGTGPLDPTDPRKCRHLRGFLLALYTLHNI